MFIIRIGKLRNYLLFLFPIKNFLKMNCLDGFEIVRPRTEYKREPRNQVAHMALLFRYSPTVSIGKIGITDILCECLIH